MNLESWIINENEVYIPYTFKTERHPDPRDMYLNIQRVPGKEELNFNWVKQIDGEYFKLSSFILNTLFNSKMGKIGRLLMSSGYQASVDTDNGVFANFGQYIINTINNSDGFEALKNPEYEVTSDINEYSSSDIWYEINTRDMWDIVGACWGKPKEVHNHKYKPSYNTYDCKFHDHECSALVYGQIFECKGNSCHTGKIDQVGFIKKEFRLTTKDEVIKKYLELNIHPFN